MAASASAQVRPPCHRATSLRAVRPPGDGARVRGSALAPRGCSAHWSSQLARAQRPTVVSRRTATLRVFACAARKPLKVMIAGPPAAGKGTQCARIVEKFGLDHVCVGDILREEINNSTEAGKLAKGYMDEGKLVPNELVVDMVCHRLKGDATGSGWLLDGYPRSREQADAIEKEHIRPDVFVLIDVPDEVLVERISGRRLDPNTGQIYHMTFKPPPADIVGRLVQRSDDTADKMVTRLQTYHSNLDAIMDIYEDVTVHIDGNRDIDEVFGSIAEALEGAAVA